VECYSFYFCFYFFTITIDRTYTVDVSDSDWDDSADMEEAVNNANILGYVARNIASLFVGHLPFSIRKIQPVPKLVNTISKFDKLMELLERSKVIAVDSETTNLNRVANNPLLTLQFAVSTKRGFVLPILHKDSPFNVKQLSYIKRRLREFFIDSSVYNSTEQYLIFHNGKFDLTQIRHFLGIPVMFWSIWDTMAGEHNLDENVKVLATYGTPYGNLAQLVCHAGNDYYYRAAFSKGERSTISQRDLTGDVLNYCAFDVQSLFGLHLYQKRRSAIETLEFSNTRYSSFLPAFKNLVLRQMSNDIHMFSHMEHRGVFMDKPYMIRLASKSSPINTAIQAEKKKLYGRKSVKRANLRLLRKNGIPTSGLFGGTQFIFDINKPDHKRTLFFEVLKLKALSEGAAGKSVDKFFQKANADVPEVKSLSIISVLAKLKSSYVDKFIHVLGQSEDGQHDGRLRPSYGFFKVLTGRGNSEDPSLHQIPTRSKEAKYVKRMFGSSPGCLLFKMDYSAHEVRGWSIISGDTILAEVFAIGRRLRQKYLKFGTKKLREEINLKGDIHKLNVEFFFKVPVTEVTGDQRADIKGVAFGAIYGKSAKTLARDLKKAVDYAEGLYKKFFGRFKRAAGWLEWAKKFSRIHKYVYCGITKRRRNLFGYMTEVPSLVGAMERRAMNSPIQGMGADFGHTAARLFMVNMYQLLLKLKRMAAEDPRMPVGIETMVHDSIRGESPYELLLMTCQVLQWCATLGTQEYYEEFFGASFTVPLEIEMEFGADESRMYKWDWNLKGDGKEDDHSLYNCIRLALTDKQKDFEPSLDVDKMMESIYADWNNSKVKALLDKQFPILGNPKTSKPKTKEIE
jgi:DNA polymerase I-like protein with 3'-5' exonuclease and polymerase domains